MPRVSFSSVSELIAIFCIDKLLLSTTSRLSMLYMLKAIRSSRMTTLLPSCDLACRYIPGLIMYRFGMKF
jgi:hypothetical protein